MHQIEAGGIARSQLNPVSDRKSESGTLKKRAAVTHTGHRRNPRAGTAARRDFRMQQGRPQLSQRFAAETHCQQQPVRLHGQPALNELADRIIGPMEGHRVNDEAAAAAAERRSASSSG